MSAREAHDIILGRANDALIVEFRPSLSPQEAIDITQIERPKFSYQDRRLTSLGNSSLVTFEQTDATDRQAFEYVGTLTSFRRRPISILGELVSRQIPGMKAGQSLFQQREEIVASARALSPSIGSIVEKFLESAADKDQLARDITEFDGLVSDVISKIADPYDEQGAAFVWKTIGSGNAANAQIFAENGIQVMLGYHGQEDTDAVVELSGLVMPGDKLMHSFVGANGMVLREGDGISAVKTGPDKSVLDHGYSFAMRSLLDRAFYELVRE